MEDLAPEPVEAGELRDRRLAQGAGRPHQHRGAVRLAALGPNRPFLGRLVPPCLVDVLVEAEMIGHAEAVDAVADVVPDLALGGKRARPLRVEGERVGVQVRRHVAGCARIGVVAPSPAEVVTAVEHDKIVDPHLAHPDGHPDAREAGADDDDRMGHE
jgi:hypothetical protein